MRTVTCYCGEQIMVIPDKRVMSKAIREHSRKHEKGEKETVATFLWVKVLLGDTKP